MPHRIIYGYVPWAKSDAAFNIVPHTIENSEVKPEEVGRGRTLSKLSHDIHVVRNVIIAQSALASSAVSAVYK